MTEDQKPEGIRVAVPESFGAIFGEGKNRQWVERKVYIGRSSKKVLHDNLDDLYEDKAFKRLCEVYADIFTGWSLTTASGEPLPDPWKNPKAFESLADESVDLIIWLSRVVHTPLAMLVTVEKN